MATIKYGFECDRRLGWAHVGCGDHSFRNVLPALRYAPVELLSVCDLKEDRAVAFARVFGADRHCVRYEDVLADPEIDVVSLVMGVDQEARVFYPRLAIQALEAGKDVWMEKPPANGINEVRDLIATEEKTGKRAFCGLKKMFFPSVMRAASIIGSGEFGPPVQFAGRYPQNMPTPERIASDPRALIGFRDHLCHPMSIALRLMGRVNELMYIRESTHGGVMISLRFDSGAIGTVHLCAGVASTSPLERIEVIGATGGNIVIDNHVDVHWYRSAPFKPYGRDPDFTREPDEAPLHWQPEFSLGNLYNASPFLLGYATEIRHFCDAILAGQPFDCCGTADMLHLTAIHETICGVPPGQWARIPA